MPEPPRGPVARWLTTTYADTTPGQRWTTGLILVLAVMLFTAGLRHGSILPSAFELQAPSGGLPAAPAAGSTTVPARATALGPLSTIRTSIPPAPQVVGSPAVPAAPTSLPPTTVPPVPASPPLEGPQQQGWWWQGNAGSQQGLPTGAPPPPDVPAKGLLIEGGPGSSRGSGDACSPLAAAPTTACNAYGALAFAVPDGSAGATITLHVSDASGTGEAPEATPGSTLELCPLKSPSLNAEEGGPMADGPSFDCTHSAIAAANPDGHTYVFNVSRLPVNDGVLAVAVLPTAPTDRVVLNAPDGQALKMAPAQPAVSFAMLRYLLGLIW